MSLTPVDIIHTEFKSAFRGYRKGEVETFVAQARESIEQLIQEKSELQRTCSELEDEVRRVRAIESTLAEVLTTAQSMAEEVKANAHKQAEVIIQEAEVARVKMMIESQKSAEKCRTEIGLLQATRDRFECELRALIAGYEDMLDKKHCSSDQNENVA